MAKTKPSPKKTKPKKPVTGPKQEAVKSRRFKLRKRQKQPRPQYPKLSSGLRLLIDSTQLVRQYWKLFGGIVIVYFILSGLLVGGFGARINIPELKDELSLSSSDFGGGVEIGAILFGVLLASSSGTTNERGAVYQSVVVILCSLAIIWALRQVMASKSVGVRDAFYKGMHPLVPFLLVLLIIAVQMIPFFIGGLVYTGATNAGVASTLPEQILWGSVFFLLTLLTLYFLSSSIIALYIVTLPDMRPMAALRSARGLVRYRRWTVMRKLLFMPFAIILLGALVTIPMAMYLTALVAWVFPVLSVTGFIIGHAYIYNLYRELL